MGEGKARGEKARGGKARIGMGKHKLSRGIGKKGLRFPIMVTYNK